MKNIHVLPTDKPSRLYCYKNNLFLTTESHLNVPSTKYQNIYITSDEEIEWDSYWLNRDNNVVSNGAMFELADKAPSCKKIILTTDQDLIADGVQAIDDEFLEWFVKNPSCEEVEVERFHGINTSIAEVNAISGDGSLNWEGKSDLRDYKIIIPKEQQKQHLIDMMKSDEELGLYDYGWCKGNVVLPQEEPKDVVLGYKTSLVAQMLDKIEPKLIKCYCGHTITCDCGPEQEITLEDIFNEEKKKGVKELIDKHKQETLEQYLQRIKDRRTEDDYKYTDEDFEKYKQYISDCCKSGMSVYKCLEFMYFAEKDMDDQLFNREPKQETLEEAAERFVEAKQFRTEEKDKSRRYCFIQGAKWQQEFDARKFSSDMLDTLVKEIKGQQEKSYSEEDVINILESLVEHPTKPGYKRRDIIKFIEQFKKIVYETRRN